MKKDKGFTLVELMAVITILAILSLIIIPIVDKNVKKAKKDVYKIQIENIKIAAMNYYTDNISLRPKNGESKTINIEVLIEEDYMEDINRKSIQEEYESEDIEIKITNINGKYSYLVCPLEDC